MFAHLSEDHKILVINQMVGIFSADLNLLGEVLIYKASKIDSIKGQDLHTENLSASSSRRFICLSL
jgi:hypothetical protein